MIRIMGINNNMEFYSSIRIEDINKEEINWYWMDFNCPNEDESRLLTEKFNFHHLAVEDCLHILQRPKWDSYEDYNFFIINSLNSETLEPKEISIFLSDKYIITFHLEESKELDEAWEKVSRKSNYRNKGPAFIMYILMDIIVDKYFPVVYGLEDKLEEIDINQKKEPISKLMEYVFSIRADLLKLRRVINSMRDLLYRILNSSRLNGFKEDRLYFTDVYDHLLKLCDVIESNREVTADLRDSYMSMSSNRMNTTMMILTVISTIFIPLTFIVGIYGMNFDYMPELKLKYGYPLIMFIMILIGIGMFFWFKRKGWFDNK